MDGHVVLHFRIPFATRWGQHIVVYGEGSVLGNWDISRAHRLTCQHVDDRLIWEGRLKIPVVPSISYRYALVLEDGTVEKTEREARTVAFLSQPDGVIDLLDDWQDMSHPAYALSKSAFTDVILNGKTRVVGPTCAGQSAQPGLVVLKFRVWDWGLQDGDEVVMTGSLPQLGNWQQSQPLRLTEVETPYWEAEVAVPLKAFPVTYKYAIQNQSGSFSLEVGENRITALDSDPTAKTPAVVVRNDGPFRHEKLWRGSAAALPVFCLRTKDSVGVGEFADLKKLVDLCSATGMRMIQLLPVNDTSVYMNWWDSYPYSSLSVFALHPLYLSLDGLSGALPTELNRRISAARMELERGDVDYEATLAMKLAIARAVFDHEGDETLQSEGFKNFLADNENWLKPYAVFTFLRELFGTAEHWKWGTLHKPTAKVIDRLTSPDREHFRSLEFVYYLQYHLHCQLLDVSRYAAANRVALKGDLPIGVDKRSVDTWMNPALFNMQYSTGAPPDYFDRNGQNWGFPTYNWEEMSKDGYAWWRQRLTHMAQYFHAYRIDHILGFFRIWEIPGECTTGLLGHFRPSLPLTRHELESHGIWDFDRLCDPFVTWTILEDTFGDLAQEVASKYFVEHRQGYFKFRPQFASESDIEAIQARAGSPAWLVDEVQRTRTGLLRLRQNVVLLRDSQDSSHFYPRINLQDTSSFQELEPHWKGQLQWLHDDYFYRRQEDLWRVHALKTLPVLMGATRMLVCGEDLGMIPACVQPVLAELGLIGLRIQRMPSEPNQEFGDPASYPYMVVASPSCHDTSTSRAWWEEDPDRRERFFFQALGGEGPAPERCTPGIMKTIVRQHLESPAMWAIFPLQDLLALSPKFNTRPAHEETINNPTVRKHYWRYRMHVNVEQLLSDKDFVQELQALMLDAGRCAEADLPTKLNGRSG
ncbi:hypothetical protein WJX72_010729 [[Myrmecia] bisecta]|uniref:4-alpha-glucanotransferase n=1 Tax=[Myrmecia] bisecta TaxID=41462 RepID=A0AAW1QTC1_9CHLO